MLRVVVIAIVSRKVTPMELGTINACIIMVEVGLIFSQFGVGPAIIQKKFVSDIDIWNGFVLSVLLGTAIFIIGTKSEQFIVKILNIEEIEKYIKYFLVIFPVQSVSVVSEAVLQRRLEFKVLSLIRVISFSLGYGLVCIVLIYCGVGVYALIYGYLCQAAIKSVCLISVCPVRVQMKFSIKSLYDIVFFSFGYTVARVFNNIAVYVDKLIVGRDLGAVALGYYGRAFQMMSLPANYLGQSLETVLFPAMASIKNEKQRLSVAYKNNVILISLVMLPISTFFFFVAKDVVLVVMGEAWSATIEPLRILSIGMFFRTSYKINDSLSRAVGRVYDRAWRQAVFAVTMFFGALWGGRFGVVGVSVGVSVSLLINYFNMAHLGCKIVGISLREYFSFHWAGLVVAMALSCMYRLCQMIGVKGGVGVLGISKILLFGGILVGVLYIYVFKINKQPWIKDFVFAQVKGLGLAIK